MSPFEAMALVIVSTVVLLALLRALPRSSILDQRLGPRRRSMRRIMVRGSTMHGSWEPAETFSTATTRLVPQ